jgi:hypothetical protein
MAALARSASLSGDFNRKFRTIGLRKPGLVLKPFGHGAVADFVRVAEFVEIEQLRRQRFAAGVSLAFLLIDTYFQFTRHSKRSSVVALISRTFMFPGDYSGASVIRQRPNGGFPATSGGFILKSGLFWPRPEG